ncbi:hypothetical protein A2U01_0000636 [Trifolium medium]|uniref:Uncharacterized protein n=1 Tax=Trifolium medium TaxID=97028 RepID=A0A392LYA7_9FABA|nr:hypothetical protein [Trifolium medium]
MVGDISRFTTASITDLQKKALGHGLKGLLLSYLLSSRHEQEVSDAKGKMDVVDQNLASIEKEYTTTKDKLSKEIEDVKASQKSEVDKLKKEYEDKLVKIKESYADTEKKHKENVAAQGELISTLTKERDEALSGLEVLKQDKSSSESLRKRGGFTKILSLPMMILSSSMSNLLTSLT